MNLNKVFILGNLTRDPEVKALSSGQSVVSFGMATNRFFTDKSGEKKQEVEYHNIVAFGKLADTVSRFLTKGSLALIEGRLKTRSWQDASGNTRYRTEIIAERLQLGPRGAAKFVPGEKEAEKPEKKTQEEDIPIIEEEIDVEDIPF